MLWTADWRCADSENSLFQWFSWFTHAFQFALWKSDVISEFFTLRFYKAMFFYMSLKETTIFKDFTHRSTILWHLHTCTYLIRCPYQNSIVTKCVLPKLARLVDFQKTIPMNICAMPWCHQKCNLKELQNTFAFSI